MAMLAEPRRKQKVINLRAKNSAWSKDANKFGQRMLEKMGWSAGKGLGAKENGIVDHVVARYKNDEKGLGFEDRNDQWTKHEDDFNALLANLSNGDDKESKTHSGVSLEVKSKKSKARVHFHKFTRAKDLSRYSEKDLANIFGKKELKPEKKKEEIEKKDIIITEQVFTEKGSMADYFKNKLQALNSKNKVTLPFNENKYEDDADCGFRGFSGTTNDTTLESEDAFTGFGCSFYSSNLQNNVKDEPIINSEEKEIPVATEGLENIKKKKKKKTKKVVDSDEVLETQSSLSEKKDCLNTESGHCIPYEYLEVDTKKDKKSKKKQDLQKDVVKKNVNHEKGETKKNKKSKKRQDLEENVMENENREEENYVPKKKKKKKNKNHE
ncbi:PIN2/TERF1-interacting telomerase inhibitor 1 [Cydia splendana]|uniref:PIN2/TERF1-interacting telomerase inhibitor 1 n=1 Tax=Cydia splendana TaxID=1100963 RepID=UPI00212CDBC2